MLLWCVYMHYKCKYLECQLITGNQIRSARAALRWTSEDLARSSGLAIRTVKNIESHDGVPACRATTLLSLQNAFEAAGIEFIGTPDDGPGIRLRRPKA
jgi:hypothetical protein